MPLTAKERAYSSGRQGQWRLHLNSNGRKWIRFRDPSIQVAWITPAGAAPAEILEESFDGICLALDEPRDVSRGSEVELMYQQAPMFGMVESVETTREGRLRVQLLWRASASSP